MRRGVPIIPGATGLRRGVDDAKHMPRDRLPGHDEGVRRAAGGIDDGRARPRGDGEGLRGVRAPRLQVFCDGRSTLEKLIVGPARGDPAGSRTSTGVVPPQRARVLHPATAPEGHRGTPSTPYPEIGARAWARPPSARPRPWATATRAPSSSSSTGATVLTSSKMNTRLQVEHPITELTTGTTSVVEQLRSPAGEPLSVRAGRRRPARARHRVPHLRGDPVRFLPSPGRITKLSMPAGDGVRVDTGRGRGRDRHAFLRPAAGELCRVGA